MVKESEKKDGDETERQVERNKERKKHRNHKVILQISRGHKVSISFIILVSKAHCHEPCKHRTVACREINTLSHILIRNDHTRLIHVTRENKNATQVILRYQLR